MSTERMSDAEWVELLASVEVKDEEGEIVFTENWDGWGQIHEAVKSLRADLAAAQARLREHEAKARDDAADLDIASCRLAAAERERAELVEALAHMKTMSCPENVHRVCPGCERGRLLLARLSQPPQQATEKEP